MQRVLVVCALMIFLGWTAAASGSMVVYQPERVSVTVPAGASQQVSLSVGVSEGRASTYFVRVLDRLEGTLPAGWVAAVPATAFVSPGGTVAAVLTVNVPPETLPGMYAGILRANAMAPHDPASPGNGVRLEVTVPSRCSGIPLVKVHSFAPSQLWPPDGSINQVIITGSAAMPEGCSVQEAGVVVEDEYGVYSGIHQVPLAEDGGFSLIVPVEASRRGQDKDGRSYGITVYVRNEAGSGSSRPLTVTVPHDRREK